MAAGPVAPKLPGGGAGCPHPWTRPAPGRNGEKYVTNPAKQAALNPAKPPRGVLAVARTAPPLSRMQRRPLRAAPRIPFESPQRAGPSGRSVSRSPPGFTTPALIRPAGQIERTAPPVHSRGPPACPACRGPSPGGIRVWGRFHCHPSPRSPSRGAPAPQAPFMTSLFSTSRTCSVPRQTAGAMHPD